MGLASCKPERDAERQNRQIESQIRIENQANKRKVKMLLLGITDSGKSTIVKQMRVNYLDGFNETEVVNAIFVIRNNIIDAFKNISNIILHSDINSVIRLFAHESGKIEMMQEVDELKIINTVRDYTCIKEFFERFSCHPAVPDHIHYFFPNLDRIAVANYIPTPEDLIHMRQTTLGVHEISFDYTKHTIRLIDVGGQKTERRKWIHFFEGVTAVMFTCSLASFNQTTEEEPKSFVEGNGLRKQSIPAVLVSSWESSLNKVQNRIMVRSSGKARVEKPGMINRLDEAVDLFRSIRENHFLRTATFMLFLNKVDLLAKKLSIIRFSEYFPDYKKWINGDNSVASVAEFIESMFREGLEPDQKIYAHLIQATVTTNVEFTFALCCDVIFERNLEGITLE